MLVQENTYTSKFVNLGAMLNNQIDMSLDIYKTFLDLCCYFQKCVEEKEDKSVSLDYYVFPPSYFIIITNRMTFELNQGILM